MLDELLQDTAHSAVVSFTKPGTGTVLWSLGDGAWETWNRSHLTVARRFRLKLRDMSSSIAHVLIADRKLGWDGV